MESIRIENLSFSYASRNNKTLCDINLTINRGEFILLCGNSGCGKTTLLRLLKPSLTPFGEREGNIFYNGKPITELDEKMQTTEVGFVMQNPDNQIVTDKVWHELAFGLESIGLKQREIRARVSEMASFFGIQDWFYKNVTDLSGGQKQLLNLASIMVMQPSVLLLDEPTSQLDPISAGEFLKTLQRINQELGTTIILTEHRIEDAFPMADRVVVMDDGRIFADDKPGEIGKFLIEKNHHMYKALPTPVKVYSRVEGGLNSPLTVRDGRLWLEEYSKQKPLNPDAIPKDEIYQSNEIAVEFKDVWFRYEKALPDVVKGLNVKINKGELFCMVGGNGEGKTTFLSLLSGQNIPYRGQVLIQGQDIAKIKNLYNGVLGVLPQNPQSLFLKKTIYLDLMEMLSDTAFTKEEKEEKIKNTARLCRIEELIDRHPYDISGGEQQRTALAKILLANPEILLLDEPTKGIDAQFKEEFAEILMSLKTEGVTIVMVSHDIEFCAKYADRCAMMFDGNITSEGTPREFFRGKSFYTTAANRMARTCLLNAVLAEDIILACGGKVNTPNLPKNEGDKNKTCNETKMNTADRVKPHTIPDKKASGKSVFALLLLLVLVPLTLYAGPRFFGSRRYYITSILIIFETIAAFCISFESRKPKAREIVVISVLCAIAVAGRAAFAWFPQFKPTLALVIIAGVCYGGETGFLVGAVTGFVSNFFFGQGPWTPWQMFALGIIGFLAGVVFKKSTFKKSRTALCLFGLFSALVIYGGIMNPASVIMVQNKITLKMIVASCLAGLPVDLIHAVATVFFLWILSRPMIEKMERIKIKYGLF